MIQEIKEILPKLAKEVHQLILDNTDNRDLNMKKKQLIGEAAISFSRLFNAEYIMAHERVLMERAFIKAFHLLYDDEALYYFSSFYYAYRNVKDNDLHQQQIVLMKTNLDTMAMLLKVLAVEKRFTILGTSLDNCFFTRIERFIWALEFIINKEEEELYIPGLYNICNIHQTLIRYLQCGDSKYNDLVKEQLRKLHSLLLSYGQNEKINNLLSGNLQLQLFNEGQKYLYSELNNQGYKLEVSLEDIDSLNNEQKLRVLTSLFVIDKELFSEKFELIIEDIIEKVDYMNDLQKVLLLRVIGDYLVYNEEKDLIELNLVEPFESIDIVDYMMSTFKKYSLVGSVDVTEEDLTTLQSLGDQELRTKVAEVILGADSAELLRESKKPHGVFEISDMEVKTRYRGKRLFLCMPFKSGKEIKSKSVPVEISYQIVRPFIEFKKCVVIFITAKKCSENLMNYIKKLQDHLGWPIGVIEERQLAALLKTNGKI
ncbi:hypothetical protein ACNQFZ_11760 [Schinkia sp. CFF1]